jgi:prepilin-type N-terminal cleavage/methylation domain-containing protein
MTCTSKGFTLLEMIIVIVLLGIASAAVVGMVSQVNAGSSENTTLQVGGQLLQECGEWILANHRRDKNFFDDVLTVGTSTNCFSGPGTYSGFSTPSVTISDVSTDASLCPAGYSPAAQCKQAVVTVTSGTTSLAQMTFVVVRYND